MGGFNLHAGEALARYGFGGGHPFGNDRYAAFWNECSKRGLPGRARQVPPVVADEAVLLCFHTAEYVERVQHQSRTGEGFLDDGDTPAFVGVYEAAATVVGTTLDAVGRIMRGEAKRAFVPIAGLHHARRERAAGFCVFNDIGCAIEALRAEHGVRRIGYVDIDAHHGDGVQYSFEDDPDLFFADLHEDGRYLYPGTGAANETGVGVAIGTKLNIPMAPGADDAAPHPPALHPVRACPRHPATARAGRGAGTWAAGSTGRWRLFPPQPRRRLVRGG
jgi:acetoin utilization protein AcuC